MMQLRDPSSPRNGDPTLAVASLADRLGLPAGVALLVPPMSTDRGADETITEGAA
jgi:hypothetical protein